MALLLVTFPAARVNTEVVVAAAVGTKKIPSRRFVEFRTEQNVSQKTTRKSVEERLPLLSAAAAAETKWPPTESAAAGEATESRSGSD